jgi:hypothetical protein
MRGADIVGRIRLDQATTGVWHPGSSSVKKVADFCYSRLQNRLPPPKRAAEILPRAIKQWYCFRWQLWLTYEQPERSPL